MNDRLDDDLIHSPKDFFPAVYFNSMVKGEWFGPRGFFRPKYT